jgi:DNA-binding PadR family transcriptional regulator
MEVATRERGSKGPRLTLTLTEDGRRELAELQAWLEETHPKSREEITKGKRSWWTESETVRLAIGLTLSTIKLGEVFKP